MKRCLLALLLSAPAAGTEPMSPLLAGERPAAGSTESDLWYGMDQAEKELRQSPYLLRDQALNAYVHGVACKVAGDYCPHLRVYVVDIPVFNASMAPNGAMLVFTGALLRIQDEAELALILGHEFAHFKLRHSLQQWQKAKRTSALIATLGPIVLVGDIVMLAGLANLSSFSRELERESDKVGFQQATAAGYDAQAGVRLWARMLAEEKASHLSRPLPVFASHPRTAERLEDVALAAHELANTSTRTETNAYRSATRPFLAHWLEAELSRRKYDTAIQVITTLRAAAEPDSQGLYSFYLGEAYRRRNKSDDSTIAAKLHAQSVTQPGAPADAWREFGMNLRQAGRREEAMVAFRHYLAAQPGASDRAFIEKYLLELERHP